MSTEFSKRLKKILTEKGIKQTELVAKTGIGKSAISQYIKGLYTPKTENLNKIARALNVSVSDLLGEDAFSYLENEKTFDETSTLGWDPNADNPLFNSSKEESTINTLSFYLLKNSNCALGKIKRGNKVDILKNGEILKTYDVELILKAYEIKYLKEKFSLEDIEELENRFNIPEDLKGVSRKQYIKFMGESAMFFDDDSISEETKDKLLLSFQRMFYDAKEKNRRKK